MTLISSGTGSYFVERFQGFVFFGQETVDEFMIGDFVHWHTDEFFRCSFRFSGDAGCQSEDG